MAARPLRSSRATARSGHCPVPDNGTKIYWDDAPNKVDGFGVRVWATGARAYIFDYRVRGSGRQRRYTIGGCRGLDRRRCPDRSPPPAASSSTKVTIRWATLQDERAAPTMLDLCDRFEQEHLSEEAEQHRRRLSRRSSSAIFVRISARRKVAAVAVRGRRRPAPQDHQEPVLPMSPTAAVARAVARCSASRSAGRCATTIRRAVSSAIPRPSASAICPAMNLQRLVKALASYSRQADRQHHPHPVADRLPPWRSLGHALG